MAKRVSARVLLLDENARVLLVSSRDPDDGIVVWYAPGGEVLEGEAIEDAARREIREEVGLELDALVGPVWERVFPHTFAGVFVDAHEWFFVARIAAADVTNVAETGGGARYFEGWRWWTMRELAEHRGIFGPGRLPELLPRLLEADIPSQPLLLSE